VSIFVRMKRSVVALALLAGALVHTAGSAQAVGTTLGDVTGFSADQATYTLSAGTAKVRVVFLEDDVFRLWMAPDGNFTDPATTGEGSKIVTKTDYGTPRTSWRDRGSYYSLTTGKIEVRAQKQPLKFSLYRSNGQLVWSEAAPLSWTDTSTTQTLGRGADEQFFGGGMQNGRFSHRDQTIKISRDFNWEDGGNPNASPYYMSTAGYGVLRNTFSPGSYSFTDPVLRVWVRLHCRPFPPSDEDVAREVQHYALNRLPSPEAAPALAYAGVEATPDERKSWGIIEID